VTLLNVERAQSLMDAAGVVGVVATGPENVTYLTGYANWTLYTFKDTEVYGVLGRDGSRALVAPVDAADYLAELPLDDDVEIYTYGTFHVNRNPEAELEGAEAGLLAVREQSKHSARPLEALELALRERRLASEKLAFDDRGTTPDRWRRCGEALPQAEISAGTALLRSIRMVKTEAEIDRLRLGARVVQSAIVNAFTTARAGLTEADLERSIRVATMQAGVTPGHNETSAGTRASGSFPPSDAYRLKAGDVIRSDCGGRYRGYWADTGRSAVVGTAHPRIERYYEAIRTGIEAMIGIVKPGLPVAELARTGISAVVESGIPDYRRHHVGHGLGLEMYEAPLLTEGSGATDIHSFGSSSDSLEPGMVINIELPYYELGFGGLQIEDTLVVRSGGCELLTPSSRELYRCPAVV
jgi:Xaa-Pro aminopeptidase